MKTATLLCFALLSWPLLCGTSSSDDDPRWVLSLIDLIEIDYAEQCEKRASATWNELLGNPQGLSVKLEKDKGFGIFARQQTTDIKDVISAHKLPKDDNVLKRKVKIILQPGDTLLDTDQWIRLVTFADTAQHNIRFATNYDCGTSTNCSLRELQYNMARQQDEAVLLRMKQSWESNLPNLTDYMENILPLLRNASKQNNFDSVEEYWDSLVEYEGAMIKARELWNSVKPLYVKLHKYIAFRLKGTDSVGHPLPGHLFRSLKGDDWSNIIESLLPKHAGIYQRIHANLELKELGGPNALLAAERLMKSLNLGEIEPEIWKDSIYNSSCPTTIIDWCKPNKVKLVTCKDVNIGNYINAHESIMKIKYKQYINLHSNNTYILRDPARYSAIYEAVSGLASLLSLNPHALDRVGLFPLETFKHNSNQHRLVLQLIMALRDLPKLNYYMAVDEWRLRVLTGQIPNTKIVSSWSEFRKNFSMIESSDTDFLGDSYVLFNKPYIGKFMGLILKYQVYQSFAEEMSSDESDLIEHISEHNERLIDTMMQGYGEIWPEMVSNLLAKRENGLEYTGLTDYYQFLDDYLDNQLNPTTDQESDDYVEVVEPPPEANEIPLTEKPEKTTENETHEDIIHNIIDTGDESSMKFETSTVGVLEIKNPPPASIEEHEDKVNKQEASYGTYWWIAIIVAVAIVVILVAIVARKRHNHRKQLERQRRDNTRA